MYKTLHKNNKILADTIKSFVVYAKEQGSQSSKNYYCIIFRLRKNILMQIGDNTHDDKELEAKINDVMIACLEIGIKSQCHYKEIYKTLKNDLGKYAVGSNHETKKN